MWGGIHPLSGKVHGGSVFYSRRNAIIAVMNGECLKWPTLYKKGWRIVKVQVTEIKGK